MTDVNFGDAVEVLDPLVSPSVYQLRHFVVLPSVHYRERCICRVSVLLYLHPWLCDDLVAVGCDHFSFPLEMTIEARLHGSKEF